MNEVTNNYIGMIGQVSKNDVVNRTFFLNDYVEAKTLESIILGIIEINRQDDVNSTNKAVFERKPIKVIIDSFGGDCYSGMALVNVILTSKTPVHTYCYGKAMSMGLEIFAVGHKRFAHKHATLMQHQLAGGSIGKLNDMIESVSQKIKLQEMLDSILVEHSNIPMEKLDSLRATKTDWFFTGEEAVELGVVDELIKDSFTRKKTV